MSKKLVELARNAGVNGAEKMTALQIRAAYCAGLDPQDLYVDQHDMRLRDELDRVLGPLTYYPQGEGVNARTHGTATRRATLLLDAEAEETRTCAFCGEQSTASFAGARDWTWVRPAVGRVFQPCCPGCNRRKCPEGLKFPDGAPFSSSRRQR